MFCPPQDGGIEMERLRAALEHANLPTLLMVLHQLTGERRWLEPPFSPARGKGLEDDDSGGFPPEVQTQIRAAAVEAVLAWNAGRSVAVPSPTGQDLVELMAWCTADRRILPKYETMCATEMGFVDPPAVDGFSRERLPTDFNVVVIGAGIGGLLASMRLRELGIPHVVIERNEDVGGTWLTSTYPGAGVDTPSYLYSFSFYSRNWSSYYPKQPEVLEYLRDFTRDYGLRSSIRFDTEVLGASFDEPSQRWTVKTGSAAGQDTVTANAVISAVGIFGRPLIPDIPGLDEFEGPLFHSANWPTDLDMSGRRVAVIGSGASAMQVVPAIAGKVASLTVFQRSPMWAAPVPHYFNPVSEHVHWLMERVPFYHLWYRFRQAWTFNDKAYASLFKDPDWPHPERSLNETNDRHRQFYTRHIESQLDGRDDLVCKAIPDYPPFGKRMLIDNGWFSTLRRPNVELLDEPCVRVTRDGAAGAHGAQRRADVVVLCTGFQAQNFLAPMKIEGRGARDLHEDWQGDNPQAYLGLTAPGYPNLFFIYGPNTNGAGGSYLSFAESQVNYIVSLVALLAGGEIGAIEPRPEVTEDYNRRLDEMHSKMIWTHPGMDTYYRNSRGRVVVNRPWSVVDYWEMIRHPNLADYVLEPVKDPTESYVAQ